MPYKDVNAQREYQRRWKAKRRADFFKDKACAKCGSSERLELDHVDPKLKVSHSIWSWSEPKRAAELAKCQVLCHSCHWQKTLLSIPKTDHGRGSMYQRHKCRCDLCREWKRLDDKKRRG